MLHLTGVGEDRGRSRLGRGRGGVGVGVGGRFVVFCCLLESSAIIEELVAPGLKFFCGILSEFTEFLCCVKAEKVSYLCCPPECCSCFCCEL